MLRKIVFISLALALVIGFSSASFTESQPKPKTTKTKKTKAKKSSEDENKGQTTATESQKLTWYTMTEGYAKAKKEKKILVVDVYTDWCYWCKVMDKMTYENKNIVTKMKKYAVAVKFNPEVNANHKIGEQTLSSDQLATYLAKGGRIPGYPMTFVWKDFSSNSTIEPYSGYLDTTQFNAVLNKHIQQ